MHQTPYVHRMFRDVFTGIDTRQKKAIPINELHTLLNEDPQSDKLRRTQAIANLLFYFAECLLSILPIWKSQIWKGIC